jgi:hypothetical protein
MAILLHEYFYILVSIQSILYLIEYVIVPCSISVLNFRGYNIFQSGRVREAAWKSDWVGSPISHQHSINILMTVSKDFNLTAGKIIPISRRTMMLVRSRIFLQPTGSQTTKQFVARILLIYS